MPDPTAVDTTPTADGLRALTSFFWHLSRQGTPDSGTSPPPNSTEAADASRLPFPAAEATWLRQLAGAVTPGLEQDEVQRLAEGLRDQPPPAGVPESPEESVCVLEQSA